MSNAGLFAAGLVVTLLVLAGLGLVVWGIILDGRDDASRRATALEHPSRG